MRISRTAALGLVAWLAVVAVGSATVWFVISSAGQSVGTAGEVTTGAAATFRDPAPPAPQRTHRPGHPLHPATASPVGRPSTAPRRRPQAPRPRRDVLHAAPPGSSTARVDRTATAGDSVPATPAPAADLAGARRLRHRPVPGQRHQLIAAQPDDGYSVEVGDRAPVTLEVHFPVRGPERPRVRGQGRCGGGVPRFASHSGGDRDG